jgi:ATP/maltotriose-dependent transcriptional regulator MalT
MLSSIDAPARSLVEAAAVMDTPTELAVLGRVAELADPSEALGGATAAGLTVAHATGAVECAHALLGDAVRRSLSPSRRRDLHARAAEWCTGDRRLAHRAAAADRPDPELAAELRYAADVARRGQQYALAATHRLRARAVSDEPGERERLLLDALIERVDAQDLAGAERLAGLAGDASPHSRRSLALGLLACEKGDVGTARTLLHDALERAETEADRSTSARAALAAAVLEVRVGNGAAAVDLLREAPAGEPEHAADVLTTMGIGLWQAGQIDRAVDLLDGARVSTGGHGWEADLLAARGMINLYAGRPHRALADLDAAIGLVHLWRPSTNQSRTHVLRSATRYVLGDWDGAAVDAASARALAEGPAERWSLALALAVSIDVPAGRGQWDVAEGYLHRAVAASPYVHNVMDTIVRHSTVLAAARADHAAVLDVLDPVWSDAYLERESRTRALRPVMHARVAACIAVGRLAGAEEDLARYELLLRRWPRGMVPAGLGWLRGQLAEARGDPTEAQRQYAHDLTDPMLPEFPLVLAQLLHTSGRLEHALGNRREAVDRLTRARDCFAGLRAVPYLERCRGDLAACGLPSAHIADPLALTPREEDVVALVTRGFSNKQVAAELFLTVKTVEYHLRNIYAKLGVQSRHELRRRRASSIA